MKEFILIFRDSAKSGYQPSPAEMQEVMTQWMDWMGSIAAQGKLANPGNRLSSQGAKTVKPGHVVTDGPYTEIKEFINGYIIVKTETLDEAVELAGGCPILNVGGNVEVRTIVTMDDNS